MKILHFASVRDNYAAGLSFSVPNLIKAQNLNKKVKIAFLCNIINGINLKRVDFKHYDVFVLHSFFIPSYIKLLLFIPRQKKIITCPRGTFSTSNRYNTIKHAYSLMYFGIIKLRSLNFGIHFLTENEQKRSRFHAQKEFLAGNTMDMPIKVNKNLNYYYQRKFNKKNIVYIGRFSTQHKGLNILFNLLKQHRDEIIKNNIKFSFYGPETEDKIKLYKNAKINKLSFVSFNNEVYGEEKENIYKDCMFNILTSRFEGFPMSVLESAALCIPQILSKGTNLKKIMREINFGIEFSDSFINEIIKLDFKRYKKMCERARYFAEQYSLENIGKETIKYYKTL